MRTYRDLIAWQKSIILVNKIYQITRNFPLIERFGLAARMQRTAASIPSNIAEGYGRNATKDYVRFLRISLGSVYELQTHIELAHNLHYIVNRAYLKLFEKTREIERMLSSLINKLPTNI
jgi:four helix bundle protein